MREATFADIAEALGFPPNVDVGRVLEEMAAKLRWKNATRVTMWAEGVAEPWLPAGTTWLDPIRPFDEADEAVWNWVNAEGVLDCLVNIPIFRGYYLRLAA